MTDAAKNLEVARLADQLERSFFGGAWHGPAVLESLDGIEAREAARRPVAEAHSIWEIAGHAGAWMRVAAGRLRGEDVPSLEGEDNFPPASEALEASWKGALDDLRSAYRELREALQELEDAELGNCVAGCDPTVRGLLLGVLQHNAYHAGQIVLLRKVTSPREAA